MKIERVRAMDWSPTGGTRRVTETVAAAIAETLQVPCVQQDVTLPSAPWEPAVPQELVVFGAPTYAGKLPNKLLPVLKERLSGNQALAVAVVSFGNRSYDNSLAELCAVLEETGFHTIAGGVFVCRHAFSDTLAFGRPNGSDLQEAQSFGRRIGEKVQTLTEIPAPIVVPGDADAPYYVPKGVDGQPAKFLKAKPKTDLSRCSQCGVCARRCPMQAIDPAEVSQVPGTCIKCQACVRSCTRRAKFFDDPAFLSHVAMLEATYTEPKKNESYL